MDPKTQEALNDRAIQILEDLEKQGIETDVENNYPAAKPEGHIRFVCISDTHCNNKCFQNVPDGDVLIHAGDFTSVGCKREIELFAK